MDYSVKTHMCVLRDLQNLKSLGPKITKDDKIEKNPKFCAIDFRCFPGSNSCLEHSITHIKVNFFLKTHICVLRASAARG